MPSTPIVTFAAPDADAPANLVEVDGWWPAVDVDAFREAFRVGEYVSEARAIEAIEGAIFSVTASLSQWRAGVEAAGAASLADVTADQLMTLAAPPVSYHGCYYPGGPMYRPDQAAALVGQINGRSRLVALYARAVGNAATADLAEAYRDLAAPNGAQPRNDMMALVSVDWHRKSTEAIRDMLGVSRANVGLI
jgi:hypothetical protein